MRYDAREVLFEEVEVFGSPALFTERRLDERTVPKGLHYYELRADEDGGFWPGQIGEGILANHYGGILTGKPIRLDMDGYRDIEPEKDFLFFGGRRMTAAEFRREQLLKRRKREKER